MLDLCNPGVRLVGVDTGGLAGDLAFSFRFICLTFSVSVLPIVKDLVSLGRIVYRCWNVPLNLNGNF